MLIIIKLHIMFISIILIFDVCTSGRWTWSDLTGLSPDQLSNFLGAPADIDNPHQHSHVDEDFGECCSDGSHAPHIHHSGPWHRIRLTVMGHVGLSHSPTLRTFLHTLE